MTPIQLVAAVERGTYAPDGSWCDDLAEALAAELAFELPRARAAIERARLAIVDDPDWRHLFDLADARIVVRASAQPIVPTLEALVARADAPPALVARTRHTLAVALIRLGRLDEAEQALAPALGDPSDEPVHTWMTDTMAQILSGQGAWCEAIRMLERLVARRSASGDRTGAAISGGHLARLVLQLGRVHDADRVTREAIARLGDDGPALPRLRLATLRLTALLDLGDRAAEVDAMIDRIRALLAATATEPHDLRGHAMVAIARAGRSGPEIDAAFVLDSPVQLLHEATIAPASTRDPAWRDRLVAAGATRAATESEIGALVLAARHAVEDGDLPRMRELLARADARAVGSNNALWLRLVDIATSELAPEVHAARLHARFSDEARPTDRAVRETATLVFADLVDFTPRAVALPPEEVMDTVRGLFELGVPLLARHRVVPLSYLGDGLLAIARGDDHAARGLAFAIDLVARAGRVSRIRKALGDPWALDLRAGVASGEVVLGALGTLAKSELAAIGATTNLAARLQARAAPGEVVCATVTARAAGRADAIERLALKGFADAVETCRIAVYAV